MKDINEVMLNPIRMRIIQTLVGNRSMTTTEICEKMRDVPRTTLYRHIKVLLDYEVLRVISEQKIRGSLERTLAVNLEEFSSENRDGEPLQHIFAFLMNCYRQFQTYFDSEDVDTGRDRVFCNNAVMMADDKEYDSFLSELTTLMQKYVTTEYQPGRKARSVSILSVVEKEAGEERL